MVRGNDYTGPRPHVQGSAAALRVRGGGGRITDAGGLVVVRKLWDALGLGGWIDRRSGNVPGRYRPSLMVESWVVLLLYGGGVMDDLPLLERRGVRRIFGWARVPHPGHVRALVAGFGGRAVAASGRAVVADGAAALGAGRRGAAVGDDRHGLDRRGALRTEAGGGGAGLQPEEAGPSLRTTPFWPTSWRRATASGCAGGRGARTRPGGRRRGWPSWWPA